MILTKVKKQLTFSDRTIDLAQQKASKLGMDFAEYVRYVITKDLESEIESEVSANEQELNKKIKELENFIKGKASAVKQTSDTIDDYISKL